ncbi:MAG TPA: alpha-ketoacid dehydrogenase subunit beta, partial [Calditrichia bacterium]|nr:alpha-ketoacid dehydrogenase subunit beta [Calditrichia bacterium]
RFEAYLEENNLLPEKARREIRTELAAGIEAAIEDALNAPLPDSNIEAEMADVYATGTPFAGAPSGPSSEKRYVDAVSDGLRQAMENDPSVLVMGQDVAEYGGVFKVTQGFVEQFGKARVRNTPIIESGAIGAAMGLAMEGFKPVVEMQFSDFVTCGFNQIVNNLAKTYYRWNTPLNVTLRLPSGGGVGAGPFHSQNPEGWFFQVAGLKVVAPATPADAKGLLMSAIQDPNPVLIFEHKGLYRSIKEPIADAPYGIEIGKARVAREGQDLTVISYGIGVHWALETATLLAREDGVDIEVLDLRSLLPWDREAVLASVRKTGRVLILNEAPVTGSISGEIAAWIGENAFGELDAPVARIGSLDTPIPFSPRLEQNIFWPKTRLVDRLRELLAF